MICGNASHFFGRPVSDWTVEKADSFDYQGGVPRLRPDGNSAGFDEAMLRRLRLLLARPEASRLDALVFAAWGAGDDLPSDLIEVLVASRKRLPALKALLIGDINLEETGIGRSDDVSDLWPAFPDLRELHLHGGAGLAIGDLALPGLERLTIESCGLSDEVVDDVLAAKLPSLRHLELWLGTEDQGGSSFAEQFEELRLPDMPALKSLALRNCEYADELAVVIAQAPLLRRLTRLDLSLGTLGDKGAQALLASPAVAALEELDLHHHFISEGMASRLNALGPKINLDDPRDDDGYGPFVAVGE